MLILGGTDEFLIAGSGLTVSFLRDPDTDAKQGGISSIEQVERTSSGWATVQRLNGDQSNQGRQLSMDAHEIHVYRVNLYATERNPKP